MLFDAAATIRRDAGELSYQVLADSSNATNIVHFSKWTNLTAARAFFELPELVRIRAEAGVQAPNFLYLDELEAGTLT
ncbi:antibiotic biosynthesis monooxygenase [Antrihabitans spumae]|uniref:Antibiotic biosynthesis monooxygenase n=1 Tax=Antrihabitans spumae TaxID=3373370 RepID=A0ABW7K4P0_9NOCA